MAQEVVDMRDVDLAIIVPIVVLASGLITKDLEQHHRRLPIGRWIKALIQSGTSGQVPHCQEGPLSGALAASLDALGS